MKTFTENGVTLVFFKKENDSKYSFAVKGDGALTEKLLSQVSQKRVNEKGIFFAQKALFTLIQEIKQKESDMPVIKYDYISMVKEELDSFTSNGIKFHLEDYPLESTPGGIKWTTAFNGKSYEATAHNKKIAKQLTYKQIFETNFKSSYLKKELQK